MNEPEWVRILREKLDHLLAEEALAGDPEIKFSLTQKIKETKAKLAEWKPPAPPPPPGPSPTRLRHGAPELFGREREFTWLDRAWADDAAHVVTIVAWGGTGKTALVAEWRNQLLARGHAPDWLFDWSFYSQGVRDRGAVSADNFLREALIYFGDPAMADSPASGWEKGTRLAALIRERRALLILDGLEPLQHPDGAPVNPGALKEDSIDALLRSLAQRNPGLCVITTRVRVAELERFGPTLAPRLDLEALSDAAGAELLRSLLEPSHGKPVKSTPAEREEISREVRGHALTLQLLGVYIQQALGDIRKWREIDFSRANEEQGGHAFRVMDAYVAWLARAGLRGRRQLAALRLLGFFDRPADPGCIAALREKPAIPCVTEALDGLDTRGWNALTASLEQLRLVTRSEHVPAPVRGYDEPAAKQAGKTGRPIGPLVEHRPHDHGPDAMVLDAHPLVRDYFARELRRIHDAGWREGHRRLYEHLRSSVPHWPEGIAGLQPLYQAVVHGCAAGRTADVYLNVYQARITRGARFYSNHHLGAVSADLAAVACFFEHNWDTPSTALDAAAQSWVLNTAAYSLRALGRLRDALGPMRAGLDSDVRREDWKNAAIAAGNLSELELTLGQTSAAIDTATKSVEYGERSDDDFQRISGRTALADARHQAGDLAAARALFAEAEAMEARIYPAAPQLHALRGHQYCDLLLRPAERAAWHAGAGDSARTTNHVNLCQAVVARASSSLRNVKHLLSIALDHLTLGRAALHAAILLAHAPAPSPALSFTAARTHLDVAVDGLRQACAFDDLPRALISRARLLHRTDPNLALRDLDDAQTLADRGPMPLFQADIHLTRARLFHDRAALALARELIERHGYGRRLDELADADTEALTWPTPAR